MYNPIYTYLLYMLSSLNITYIIGHYNLQSELRPSFSYHPCCVRYIFIHEWRGTCSSKVNSELQIFEKLFVAIKEEFSLTLLFVTLSRTSPCRKVLSLHPFFAKENFKSIFLVLFVWKYISFHLKSIDWRNLCDLFNGTFIFSLSWGNLLQMPH